MVRKEMMKKGPWTEEEDVRLVLYVNLFGDRRWDFLAKISGLNRTGKSCRLRWLNYLHPGLRRGKMSLQEERLVLDLHAQWGNSWSKIARELPGRTDNEIKNYCRTHMRKKAKERKMAATSASSSLPLSNSSSSSSSSNNSTCRPRVDSLPVKGTEECGFYDTGELEMTAPKKKSEGEILKGCTMDETWKDVALAQDGTIYIKPAGDIRGYVHGDEGCDFSCQPMASPVWDYSPDFLWMKDQESLNTLTALL